MAQRKRRLISLICAALGLYLILIAAGLLPARDNAANAPNSILALTGLIFVIGGWMAYLGRRSRMNELMAAVLLLLFGAVGAWVSLFSPSEGFSGGIPFIPYESNVSLARVLFGFGSLICFALSAWAFSRFLRYTE